jgi:cysteinyl-tRNA synthetase
MIKSDIPSAQKSADLLAMDKILGLELDKVIGQKIEIPEEVQKLVDQRENARKQKDFKRSDELRKEIKRLGYEIEDSPQEVKLKLTNG